MNKHGHIQLILGPMFSGKTSELIRRIKRYETANHKCMVIKYAKDTRYDDGSDTFANAITTHDRNRLNATVKATVLEDVQTLSENFSVIGIDEGQFFKDVIEFSEAMANRGKIVIVAALDGTYQRKSFGDILNLVPLAESVIKLNAVCMTCYKDASFTKRKTSEQQVELIGGSESYLAVCRECYFSNGKMINSLTDKENLVCSPKKILSMRN